MMKDESYRAVKKGLEGGKEWKGQCLLYRENSVHGACLIHSKSLTWLRVRDTDLLLEHI